MTNIKERLPYGRCTRCRKLFKKSSEVWSGAAHVGTASDADGDDEFVTMSAPPDPFTWWNSEFKVKYICKTNKMVGVTMVISTDLDPHHRGSRHVRNVWRCRGNDDDGKRIPLQFRNVRLRLPEDVAFRPSLFNPVSSVVKAARVFVWMVDEIDWWKATEAGKKNVYRWSVHGTRYDVNLTQPYSRPYKTFHDRCVQWYWQILQHPQLSDSATCPHEQLETPLLSFPVVLSGQTYGIHRTVSVFTDPLLESRRTRSLLYPRFSVELWVYIVDYCPLAHLNGIAACTLLGHLSTLEAHLTPVLLVNVDGQIQVEGRGLDMYVAHKTVESIPRHQWVRLLFSLEDRIWKLHWSYGKDHSVVFSTHAEYTDDIVFDETDGYFVIGGVDGKFGSFRGYMGHTTLYRGRVLTLSELSMPKLTDPMFQLDLEPRQKECQQFREWFDQRVAFYRHKTEQYRQKHSCSNTYTHLLIGLSANLLPYTCPRRPSVGKDQKHAARLLRSAVVRGWRLSGKEGEAVVVAGRLLAAFTAHVADHGLGGLHQKLPLLEQASCLGNMDATYTLAVCLKNGVGANVQEYNGLSMLMRGSLNNHRLSSLSLAHHHTMGLHSVPCDMDIAYMYYKDVGDKTKDERETHAEDEVFTESIRLMDEETLSEQVDETGDVFMWLKHQAQQGVQSAQVHLAQLYFWGSQGMQRNLQAARHFFQQGAAQGDAESLYNLGIMDILGRGIADRNETSGKERLNMAAEQKHPYAISALGWLAMEKEQNYSRAASLFENAFNLDFMDAGYYLGHMYHHGLYPGTSADTDIAVGYYQWAAERGHVHAALLFAHFLSKGTKSVPRNSHFAMEWARYIAEQNSVIGKLLREGVNAYRQGNIPLAAYYYLLSSEAGMEVASFNLAWLCEEQKEVVTAAIGKECQWKNYNLTVQRDDQFVDPYSYIKMGDYFWYGCQGERNTSLAAEYYAKAGVKDEPHALFNLAFMVEEGAKIQPSVWESLDISRHHQANDLTLLMELYERCRESSRSEAFIPCTLALYRVWLAHLWYRYHLYFMASTYLGCVVAMIGTLYFLRHWLARFRQQPVQLYQF